MSTPSLLWTQQTCAMAGSAGGPPTSGGAACAIGGEA
ncbi:MAG: hypothetical protein GEEBNDBF_01495 [bacterium]|nr:hypothetical protein [bacterium]